MQYLNLVFVEGKPQVCKIRLRNVSRTRLPFGPSSCDLLRTLSPLWRRGSGRIWSVSWTQQLRGRPVCNAIAEATAFLISETEMNSQMDARFDHFLRGL